MRIITLVTTWLIAALVGAVFGVAGTITHAFTWGPVPVGLLLAIIGCGAMLLAVRLLTDDRWLALAVGAGMMVATVAFSGTGPGGSVVVPAKVLGTIWVVAVPLLVMVVVALPNASRPATARRLTS